MSLSRKDLLKRIRYARRVSYASEPETEPEYEEPPDIHGYDITKMNLDEKFKLAKEAKEKLSGHYLLDRYIPEKYDIPEPEVVNMMGKYLDRTKQHHQFHHFLDKQGYAYAPVGTPPSQLINLMREKNRFREDRYIKIFGNYLFSNDLVGHAYNHLIPEAAKIAQLNKSKP